MALAWHSWPWRETSQTICSSTKLAETVLVFRNWTLQGPRYLWWIEYENFTWEDIMWCLVLQCWTYCPGCDRLWDCLPAICRSWADLPQMLEQRENSGAAKEVLKWSNYGHNCPLLLFSCNIYFQEYEGFPTSTFWQTDPWSAGSWGSIEKIYNWIQFTNFYLIVDKSDETKYKL